MNKKITIIKIISVSLLLILLSGIGVLAVSTQSNSVEIILASGYRTTVFTTKNKVKDILKENNIILGEEEKVSPDLDEEISENGTITITNKSEQEVQIAKISESGLETPIEQILVGYNPITEKIVKEQEPIPYETITKSATDSTENIKNRVIQDGEDGIKEITYKIKYQNNTEIEKKILSEEIIKEPVSKIVQVQQIPTSRNATTARNTANSNTESKSTSQTKIYRVTAYCPCVKCCGSHANGITAMGTYAKEGHTVAAPSNFSFGTKLSINGKTYTVEDRGGAIKGNRIDIYVNTHSEALAWGVRYLPVEVLN